MYLNSLIKKCRGTLVCLTSSYANIPNVLLTALSVDSARLRTPLSSGRTWSQETTGGPGGVSFLRSPQEEGGWVETQPLRSGSPGLELCRRPLWASEHVPCFVPCFVLSCPSGEWGGSGLLLGRPRGLPARKCALCRGPLRGCLMGFSWKPPPAPITRSQSM